MKAENKDKRVLQVELDDNVKKVAITGVDADDKVVMRQELNEDDLDQVAGGLPRCVLTEDRCQGAMTDRIDDREIFMKGIDYSYYYEQEDGIND